MTTTFYAPPEAFDGRRVVLPEAEARHATKVLRLRAGAEIAVVDGWGGWHRVRLVHTEVGKAVGEVVETEMQPAPPPLRLALALLKSDDRFEFAVEKAVEIGATEIVPLRTARVEAGAKVRHERVEGVVVAAMKQSLRAHRPRVHAPIDIAAVLGPHTVVLHEGAPLADTLAATFEAALATGGAPTLVVGPEGGFTDAELAAARVAGAHVASLGAARLRAETAAVVAVALAVHLRA